MAATVYYFTGTGNSLAIARELTAKIADCRLVSMANSIRQTDIVVNTEKVGFVFPLYYFGLPAIVEDFIKKINLENAKYIFFVENRGGMSSPEYVTSLLTKLIKDKGKTLSAGFKICMPNNFIKGGYQLDSEETVQRKLLRAKSMINEIASAVNSNGTKIMRDNIWTLGFAKLVNHNWRKKVYQSDKGFLADSKCNSCGICQRVCPVENIILTAGVPQWNHQCQECLACINLCPKSAIQHGNKTSNKGRYRHPDISVKDIIECK